MKLYISLGCTTIMKARDRADSMCSSSKKMVCTYIYNVLLLYVVCICCVLVCIYVPL